MQSTVLNLGSALIVYKTDKLLAVGHLHLAVFARLSDISEYNVGQWEQHPALVDSSSLLVHCDVHDTADSASGFSSCPSLRQEVPVVERISGQPHVAAKQVLGPSPSLLKLVALASAAAAAAAATVALSACLLRPCDDMSNRCPVLLHDSVTWQNATQLHTCESSSLLLWLYRLDMLITQRIPCKMFAAVYNLDIATAQRSCIVPHAAFQKSHLFTSGIRSIMYSWVYGVKNL